MILWTTLLVALSLATQEHEPLSDERIREMVEHRLIEEDLVTVEVRVSDGIVELTGKVPSLWAKERASEIAAEVPDVRSVENHLSLESGVTDRQIAQRVSDQIRRYVHYTIYDEIGVRVEDGVVTLTGRVTAPYKANEIARMASRVKGVREVRNEIRTLPVSAHDDQLRAQIASRIYGDPLFFHYSIQSHPPIHIVVENGRVTLHGVVRSEIEKRKAEHIARSTFGVFEVVNNLEVR